LDRALTNVYREKDRVVDAINSMSGIGGAPVQNLAGMPLGLGSTNPMVDAPAGGENAGSSSSPKKYVVQKGDTLSHIAVAHNTTVAALLKLNPFLNQRPEYMVWERDELTISQ
jgi:LysM repeat protein